MSGVVRFMSGATDHAESEILGAWISLDSRAAGWGAELDDLKLRGVEQIRYVVCNGSLLDEEVLHAHFPGANTLPSIEDLLDISLPQVAPRYRPTLEACLQQIYESGSETEARAILAEFQTTPCGATYPALGAGWRFALEQGSRWLSMTLALRKPILAGDSEAAALNRRLHKALERHGRFDDTNEALSFVAAALARLERRLGTAHARAVTEHQQPYEGVQPRLAALGI